MKHLLNNLSNEEKNTIREQHKGGISIDNSKFRKLLESTSGNVKPLITERSDQTNTPTSQKTSSGNNVINTGLIIDCTRRVITSTNISLTKEMNSIVIGAFCDMKNRNTEKMKSDAPPPSPATNESKFGYSKPLIMEQDSDMVITLPSDTPLKYNMGGYEKDDTKLTLFRVTKDGISKGNVIYSYLIQDYPEFSKIPNVKRTGYSKDLKTWEQDPSNPQQITLHSTNKFLSPSKF